MFKFKSKKNSFISKISKIIFTDEEEKNNKNVISKKKFTSFELIFISSILFVLGIIGGCLVTMYTDTVLGSKIDSKMLEFLKTYETIKSDYYDNVNENDLIGSAISGMLSSLDDEHSFYMDKDYTGSFNQSVDGSYVGIGITILYKDKINTITEIIKNSPAEKSGLMVGDILTKVNDVDVTNSDSNEIANLISGEVGKEFVITVKRNNEMKSFNLSLEEIEIESVYSEIKESEGKKIGYINISNFASNTYTQFNNNLTSLEKKNINSLIIDVRGNTGGQLSVVSNILDLFFEKNTVLYQIKDKKSVYKYKAKTKDKRDYPVVILTNHGSASASEVLASCFKENYSDATILGTKTYGKGTIQKLMTLSDGSSYKFTTQKWLTSKGEWLNENGLEPDVVVEIGDDVNIDNQLDEAIKLLLKK